jgi:hypothetical protein
VVLSLRSRGSYQGQTLNLELGSSSDISIASSTLGTDPLSEFTLNVTGSTSGAKSFTCTLNTSSTKYVSKVLGNTNFDKKKNEVPLYVFEEYPKLLSALVEPVTLSVNSDSGSVPKVDDAILMSLDEPNSRFNVCPWYDPLDLSDSTTILS